MGQSFMGDDEVDGPFRSLRSRNDAGSRLRTFVSRYSRGALDAFKGLGTRFGRFGPRPGGVRRFLSDPVRWWRSATGDSGEGVHKLGFSGADRRRDTRPPVPPPWNCSEGLGVVILVQSDWGLYVANRGKTGKTQILNPDISELRDRWRDPQLRKRSNDAHLDGS